MMKKTFIALRKNTKVWYRPIAIMSDNMVNNALKKNTTKSFLK